MSQVTARGEVVSSGNSNSVFTGNETLEVSAVNASLMDAPSVLLGEQKISLKVGQSFPVKFEFTYDASRAGQGYGGLNVQARIEDANGKLLYINDTSTALVENVEINVIKV